MANNDNSITITEHLSAVLDDEAGAFEQKRVLDELKSNQALNEKLSHFALIGETMRSGEVDKPQIISSASFLAGIHEKLDAEDQYNDVQVQMQGDYSHTATSEKTWLRPVGGLALAASVAAIAVLGLQNFQQPSTSIETASMKSSAEEISMAAKQVEPAVKEPITAALGLPANSMIAATKAVENTDQYKQADAQTRSHLKRFVDSHMQYASTSAFVPSVRVIAYTDNQ